MAQGVSGSKGEVMKFDKEISVRSAMLGLLTGWLASERIGLSTEAAAVLGAFAGASYDVAWFWLKKRLAR